MILLREDAIYMIHKPLQKLGDDSKNPLCPHHLGTLLYPKASVMGLGPIMLY